jgi:hypothetical protein
MVPILGMSGEWRHSRAKVPHLFSANKSISFSAKLGSQNPLPIWVTGL